MQKRMSVVVLRFQTYLLFLFIEGYALVYNAEYSFARFSETAPGNLLPKFLFQLGADVEGGTSESKIGGGRGNKNTFQPDDTCPDSIFEGAMEDLRGPQLPHLSQDLWDCTRQPNVSFPSIVLENKYLKVDIIPRFGGRVWSIYDKVRHRHLVYANPSHQPANIAVLGSWTSGGVEWNWSPGIIGHSVFSESPVYVAKLQGENAVRIYEYDRRNQSAWSVDLLLHNDALWFRPRIRTSQPQKKIPGYWWTCVAISVTPATRIFTNKKSVAQTSVEPIRAAPWPVFSSGDANTTFSGYPQGSRFTDNSYIGAIPSGDFFFIQDNASSSFLASVSDANDSFVPFHVQNGGNGTKFFTWGSGSGSGRFMQDFLGGVSGTNDTSRAYDYAELQTGRAATQFQTFQVQGEEAWIEVLGAMNVDDNSSLFGIYDTAVSTIANGINHFLLKQGDFATVELQRLAETEPLEILATGMPWGAVDRANFSGLSFVVSDEYLDEARPWLELFANGSFSDLSLSRAPLSYQIDPLWLERLRNSTQDSWLRDLHIAVALTESGDVNEPKRLFLRSFHTRPSVVAARCLAILQTSTHDAWEWYQRAWTVAFDDREEPARDRLIRNLATEIAYFLQGIHDYPNLNTFIKALPPHLNDLDAILTSKIMLSLVHDDPTTAIAMLNDTSPLGCFPTIASERWTLMQWWFTAVEKQANATSPVERHRARKSHPVPRNIGCPYNNYSAAGCTYW
uniref:DUF5107 domain-containing protein n=1 Tax=Aureoumbra lagunensis TaxID=44058 RepID=A0A7S3JMS0_9STRA